MNAEEVKARIKLDQERAASIGVDRTPFLFIDGVQIPFASFDEKELRGVIDAALSGRPPASPPQSPTPAPLRIQRLSSLRIPRRSRLLIHRRPLQNKIGGRGGR